MKDTAKKVGYLKGLLEGMNFEADSDNGKVIRCIADLLGDLSDRVDTLDEVLTDLNDYVESIDDDLSALEDGSDENDFHFMDDDEDDIDFSDDAEDHLHLLRSDAAELMDDDDSLVGALCPECGRVFFVDATDPEDASYVCPHCAKTIEPTPLTPANAPVAHPKKEF